MEAFAFLNASKPDNSCGSIEDLQGRLRDVFNAKVTEKRAEHISVKFQLRKDVVFHVPVTETENETLENAANLDPVLGGSRSSVAPNTPGTANLPTRQINALDALLNQPGDDHVLQKSVARHIISSLGEIDGSNWTVRQVSRADQGWTFTYICKDSYQAWTRQNSKNAKRPVIGESSIKENQDPINMSRPAFDCRGSLTVAFVKSTRTIDVKYEHTPLHKTVADLVEILVPPMAPPVPVKPPSSAKKAKPPKEPRPPRPPKAPKDPNAPTPAKKRRRTEEGAPGGENATPKKRKKKKDSTANADLNGSMIPPEMPGALPVGQSTERSLYNTGEVDGSQNGYSAYPEGLVGAENGNDSRADSQGAASSNSGVHSHSILNLPPGEAARRRDVAIKLLTERDIDPSTLSPEQFNIFANQSPELQRESLAMLVKYGAERLRIVHPTKDGASSGQSTPQGNSGASAGLGQPASATPSSPSSPSKKKNRKKKVAAPDETEAAVSDSAAADTRKRPTRGACESCRSSKTKCDKAKPSCSQCLASGANCFYPLAKPRSRVSKAATEQQEDEAPEPEPQPQPQAMDIDDEPEDLGSPGFHDPVPEPSVIQEQPVASTYSQPAGGYDSHSGFSFTDNVAHDVHSGLGATSMDYMTNSAADNSLSDYTYPAPVQQTPVPVPELPTPTVQPDPEPPALSTRAKSRRSLPSGPVSQTSAASNNNSVTGQASSWQTASQTADISPANRRSPRQARTRKPFQNQSQNQNSTHNTVSQAYDDIRQTSGWPAVTQSTTPIPLPATAQITSPYQTAAQPARAKSRQSNRAQTQTPVQSMPTARPAQTQATKPTTDSSGYGHTAGTGDTNTTTGYDNYSHYQNTRADSTSNRVTSYDQYTTNPASTMSNSYSSYDTYNSRPSNNTGSSVLQNPVPQQAASTSYNPQPASSTSNTSHWGSNTTPSSVSQTRNSQSYSTNSNTQPSSTNRSSSSYLAAPAATQPQQSQVLQGFSVRPQPLAPPATRTTSANTYNQQPQQQQSSSQRQNYNNSYSNQTHGTSGSANSQQQQQQTNWYGFTPANNTSSNYNTSTQQHNSSAAGGGGGGYSTNMSGGGGSSHSHSHTHGGGSSSYGQQGHHRSMNLSSHTYIDGGEHALYEMLRNNPSG